MQSTFSIKRMKTVKQESRSVFICFRIRLKGNILDCFLINLEYLALNKACSAFKVGMKRILEKKNFLYSYKHILNDLRMIPKDLSMTNGGELAGKIFDKINQVRSM